MHQRSTDELRLRIEPRRKDTVSIMACIGIGLLAFLLGIAGLVPKLMTSAGL